MSRFNIPQPQPPRGTQQQGTHQRQEPRPIPQAPQGYAPLQGYSQPHPEGQALDPYAGLRHDGYSYPQPGSAPAASRPAADPYSVPSSLSAPQPAPSTYAPYRTSSAGAGYGAGGHDPYAHQGAPQAHAYGSNSSFGTPSADLYEDPYQPRSDVRNASFEQWSQLQTQSQPQSQPQSQADPFAGYSPAAGGYEQGFPGQTVRGAHGAPLQPAAPQGQWGGHDPYAQQGLEPAFDADQTQYADPRYGAAQPGQPAPSSFEQGYADDEAGYEYEEAPRSWKKLGLLFALTLAAGGGLIYGYNSLVGPSPSVTTPVVKGDGSPFKVKPSDPGGKQFAHADSKVMGRLGEGGSATGGSSGDVDPATGARKVSTVVVGRDGSIQAPATEAQPATRANVSVPGMTVIDGLNDPYGRGGQPSTSGQGGQTQGAQQVQNAQPAQLSGAQAPAAQPANQAAEQPMVVTPPAAPPRKPQMLATATVPPRAESGVPAAAEPAQKPAAAPAQTKKVAAATPAATAAPAVGPRPTGAGYVAVLASVPASSSSRIDALKQFADMQQKYGAALQGKTPDVQEANLGEKGTYHRLLVGPPGSRDAASQVCTQLKSQGYSGCWVTAY